MILVHDIFCHDHHFHVDALVGPLFPLHESPAQPALVLLDKSHFHSAHIVVIVLAVLFPEHQGLILHITVLQIRLPQCMVLSLCRRLFGQAVFFIFKFLAFGNFGLQNGPCLLKFPLCVAKSDRVKAGFQKALCADTLHIANECFFSLEKLIFAGLLAPVFPGLEFAIGHFLSLLLASVLERQENSLFESCLSDHLAKHVMFGLHVLRLYRRDPLYKRSSLSSQRAPPHDLHHEVLLSALVLIVVSPSTEVIPQFELSLPTTHPIDHFHGADFVGVNALTIEVKLAP